MIKRLLQVGIILAGFASLPSWAIYIPPTATDPMIEVGGVDVLEGQIEKDALTTLCGNPQGNLSCETLWVNDLLDPLDLYPDQATWTIKDEDVDYFATSTSGVYAFELTGEPEYFLVKNGNWRALYSNLADVNWGVFDTALLADGFNLPSDEYTISHVSQSGDVPVPEPGIVGLLAIGLLGVAVARRRTKV